MPKIMIPSPARRYTEPKEAMAFLLKQSDSLACMAVRVDTGEVMASVIEEGDSCDPYSHLLEVMASVIEENKDTSSLNEVMGLLLNEVAKRIPSSSAEKIAIHLYCTQNISPQLVKESVDPAWTSKLSVTGLYYPATKEANSVLPSNRVGSPPTPFSSPFMGKLFKEERTVPEEKLPFFVALDHPSHSPEITSSSSSGKSSRSNTAEEATVPAVEETRAEYTARIKREDQEYIVQLKAELDEKVRQAEKRAEEMYKEAEIMRKKREETEKFTAYYKKVYNEQKDNPVFWDMFRVKVEEELSKQNLTNSPEEPKTSLN